MAATPYRIQWSGTNAPTFWTFGQRNSDYQDFPDGGVITGITPLERYAGVREDLLAYTDQLVEVDAIAVRPS
mgnify:CR=1 FL=1